MALFSGLAVVLSVIGIYGVMAYAVAQRTSEIGIRMALGADSSAILKLVFREGLFPVIAGLAVGLVGAWTLRNILSGFLYGISPSDTATYLAVSAGIVITAAIAILVPARRAVTVDPQTALRQG